MAGMITMRTPLLLFLFGLAGLVELPLGVTSFVNQPRTPNQPIVALPQPHVQSKRHRRTPSTTARTVLPLPDLPNPFGSFRVPDVVVNAPSEEFEPSPTGLIRQAKRLVTSDLGLQDASLLDDASFRWIGPVLDRPLSKTDYLAAGRFFDLRSAFPDLDYRSYDYRVDESDPTTVRCTLRVTGTMRGELRLRSGTMPPTGKRMTCPPEGVSITFDVRTGKVIKLCTGFGLDRQVGNTGGTTGVMAAAAIAGQPVSDWEIYPPATVVARVFGRPAPQLPESKAFLAPFPETVMVQLAKGVLAANVAYEDPTLLADNFVYVTPTVGPINKREYLDKYAKQEFDGVDPSFSYFRVDPYDPVRVWVDVKPSAPGYEGAPQAMSFTFDDEGFCTRITAGAVLDPTIGNGGGLGGPAGYQYATGPSPPGLVVRPLPRLLGRLRKKLLQPFTGVAPDDYVLPGQIVTPFAQRPTPPVNRLLPTESLSSLRTKAVGPFAALTATTTSPDTATPSKAAASATAVKQQEQAARQKQAADSQEEARQQAEAARQAKQEAAAQQRQAALAKQEAAAEARRKQAEAQKAAAEQKRQEAQNAAVARAAAQKAEAERRQREAQEKRAQQVAAQAEAAGQRKAQAERQQREVQQQRERQQAAQRAEADAKKQRILAAAQARGVAQMRERQAFEEERKKQLIAEREIAERRKIEEAEAAKARAAVQREVAERKRREEEERRKKQQEEQKAKLEDERRRRESAEREAAREREAAAKRAIAAAAEAEQRRKAEERKQELDLKREQENARRLAEERRKADELAQKAAKAAADVARKAELERQQRQKAAEASLARAKSSSTLSLFGLGGGGSESETAKQERQKAAERAASEAKPGASIPLFFLSGSGTNTGSPESGKSQRQKAAANAATKAKPGASISLFGLGGDSSDAGKQQQQRQQAAKAAVTQAKPGASISLFGKVSSEPKPASTSPAVPRPTISLFGQSSTESSAKADAEREKRKKAALEKISQPSARGTVSLFGLGGAAAPPTASVPSKSRPVVTSAPSKAIKAPPGVPTLKSWRRNAGDTVTGIISGSRNFADGERVTTSKIVSGTLSSGEVVRTGSGSRYFLQ